MCLLLFTNVNLKLSFKKAIEKEFTIIQSVSDSAIILDFYSID